MKIFWIVFVLTLLTTCQLKAQKIGKVKEKLLAQINEKIIDRNWILKDSIDIIELYYIDTFFINSALGPLYNFKGRFNKLDTIHIKINFEKKWNQRKVNKLKRKQKEVLDPLIEKYIAHYDSLHWRDIKSNKDIFLASPVSYLRYWDRLSKEESRVLEVIIRLPDKVINGVGIFIDTDFNYCGSFIQPESVDQKVMHSYQLLSEILGRNGLYKCEPVYK